MARLGETAPVGDYRVQDVINLVFGALLFIAPWALGYSGATMAARSSWVLGIVIALIAIAAIVRFQEWEEWVNLALGLAVIVAPWAMGFADVANAVYAHYVLGVLIVLACAWELWEVHHPAATHTG